MPRYPPWNANKERKIVVVLPRGGLPPLVSIAHFERHTVPGYIPGTGPISRVGPFQVFFSSIRVLTSTSGFSGTVRIVPLVLTRRIFSYQSCLLPTYARLQLSLRCSDLPQTVAPQFHPGTFSSISLRLLLAQVLLATVSREEFSERYYEGD